MGNIHSKTGKLGYVEWIADLRWWERFTPKQANQDMWSESQFYSDGNRSLPNNKSGFVKRYDAYVGIVDLDLEHRRFEKRVWYRKKL